LSGLGERAHLLTAEVDLSLHIQDVINVLYYEDLHDVVLVGHSYGGMVITGVAEQAASRLSHLVYLDAFVPQDGESAFDQLPGQHERWRAESIEVNGAPARGPFSHDWITNHWKITDPLEVVWIEQRLTPMPLATHRESVHLPEYHAGRLSRSFIYCNQGTQLQTFAERAKALGCDYYELDTTHLAMITVPHELTSLLLQIAGRAGDG
jgi:pimeloyl-ACP methyl ester carboxylesterase